ncbi:hypothetical protein [Burkholderia ubonensis]|uniref:hypothetical protein n=1 Tax=Burkholderia ubonensis TaxID=101571 RepID=UPI000757929E|nr:hypothetical protein [Burkholderia ubonensis]KWN60981.1 hypothetical protein WM23_15135 [Burkholderia ubonensis]
MVNLQPIKGASPSSPRSEPSAPDSAAVAVVDGRRISRRESQLSRDVLLQTSASANYQALWAAVQMSVTTAGDRLGYLERAGIVPDQAVRAATHFGPVGIHHQNGANVQFQLARMRVDKVELPGQGASANLSRHNVLDVIPLVLPDRHEAHTIDTGKYLANRISSGVVEHARHHGCDLFCGGGSAEMLDYYVGRGFDKAVKVSSNTSTQCHLFSSSSNGQSVLVLSGMNNETRIKHQLLQLHFAEVDLGRVDLVGSVETLKAQSAAKLREALSLLPDTERRTLFIGARWQIMEFLGKQVYGVDDAQPEGVGYGALNPRTHDVGGFLFDTATVEINERQHLMAALRMPNGDLAYDATKAFLDHGFNQVVMCGAGGRMAGKARVGDYMVMDRSRYGSRDIALAPESIQIPSAGIFSAVSRCSNVTVDSPLQETKRWLDENIKMGSVDVETAHIFRALDEAGPGVRVLPGLFVSDVVGVHPLEGKISTADAYRKLPDFVAAVLHSIRE